MDRKTFNRILAEEGIDDDNFIEDMWDERPSDEINEEELRQGVWQLKQALVRD